MRSGRLDEATALFDKFLKSVGSDGAAEHHLRLIEKTRLLKNRKAT